MSTSENQSNEATPAPGNYKGGINKKWRSALVRIFKPLGFHQRFFWTTLWLCIVFAVILLPLFCADRSKIHLPPALLWAFACLVTGVLIGFIFGVPTIINNRLPDTSQNNVVQAVLKPADARKLVEANTNLTQVSDWLTKVIIGAGLVELRELPGFISTISAQIATGMANEDLAYAKVFAGGIVIAFSVYGFIFGYLIMRIVLTEVFVSHPDTNENPPKVQSGQIS
jgi:hypothetical protein